MASLSIHLPDDVRAKAEARAAEAGYETVEQYVAALVRADVGEADNYGPPDQGSIRHEGELEAMLLRRLESTEPGVEATPAFWQKLREEARARRDTRTGR